jgi:TatA/E family protein of Tat protein translocase
MVGGLGWTEILIITGAVIIFMGGGNQLPEIARSLGEAIQEFRKASDPDREPTPDDPDNQTKDDSESEE